MRRWWLIGSVAAAAAIGIAGEWVSDASLGQSAADLATGWTLVGCGLWGWAQRPDQRRWPLMALAGILWFAGNFADAGSPAVASIGAALVYLHRGPLVHAVVAASRIRSWPAVVVVCAGYADAVVTGSATGSLTVAA